MLFFIFFQNFNIFYGSKSNDMGSKIHYYFFTTHNIKKFRSPEIDTNLETFLFPKNDEFSTLQIPTNFFTWEFTLYMHSSKSSLFCKYVMISTT